MTETQTAPDSQPATLSITEAAEKLAADRSDAPADETPTPANGDVPEPVESLIDLGDGLRVTLDQIREGFMLKADHTRKTQALAEERRALEAVRAQKLAALEQTLQTLAQDTMAPKPLQAYLAEDPVNGLQRFAQQVDRMQRLAAAKDAARQQYQEHMAEARAERDRQLAATYWSSPEEAESGVASAARYAKGYGYNDQYLAAVMVDPAVVAILDKARKYDELQAGKAQVSRMIADKPKVVRPGAKVTAQAANQSSAHNARARLKSSGSLSDAVAYLQAQRKTRGN